MVTLPRRRRGFRIRRKGAKKGPVKAIKRVLKKMHIASPERKYQDVSIGTNGVPIQFLQQGTAFGVTTNYWYLNPMAQGVDAFGRIGDVVEPSGLSGQFNIVPGSNQSVTVTVRIMLLQDMMYVGILPSSTDVFELNTNIMSEIKYVDKPRFKVLKQWIFEVDPINSATQTGSTVGSRVISFNLKKLSKIHYLGTGATSASGYRNSLFFYMSSDNTGVLGGSQPTLLGYTRLRYVDS